MVTLQSLEFLIPHNASIQNASVQRWTLTYQKRWRRNQSLFRFLLHGTHAKVHTGAQSAGGPQLTKSNSGDEHPLLTFGAPCLPGVGKRRTSLEGQNFPLWGEKTRSRHRPLVWSV